MSTSQMIITLPAEMAASIRQLVQSGRYDSANDVVCDGLRTLLAQEQVIEDWLRGEVADAYDAMAADPARALTSTQVREHVAARAQQDLRPTARALCHQAGQPSMTRTASL